jgi:hypothetical protein
MPCNFEEQTGWLSHVSHGLWTLMTRVSYSISLPLSALWQAYNDQYVVYELLPDSKFTNSLAMTRLACSEGCNSSYQRYESGLELATHSAPPFLHAKTDPVTLAGCVPLKYDLGFWYMSLNFESR